MSGLRHRIMDLIPRRWWVAALYWCGVFAAWRAERHLRRKQRAERTAHQWLDVLNAVIDQQDSSVWLWARFGGLHGSLHGLREALDMRVLADGRWQETRPHPTRAPRMPCPRPSRSELWARRILGVLRVRWWERETMAIAYLRRPSPMALLILLLFLASMALAGVPLPDRRSCAARAGPSGSSR